MADQFVHLHVHTEYSILDGAAKVAEVVGEAARLGMPALAITDHGNLHGSYEFFRAATAAGIVPVLGIEAYLAPGSRLGRSPVRWSAATTTTAAASSTTTTSTAATSAGEAESDDVAGGGRYTHATVWAVNSIGLHNLFRLTSRAWVEGMYGKPRMDAELLAAYAPGLVATTGCPSGEVQTRLRLGQVDEALAAAAAYRDIFGADSYFLELMDHGLAIERRVRDDLLDLGHRLGIRPVVTNDLHYTRPEQAEAHDALLCVQTNATLADTRRFRFTGSGYYLKPAADMYALDSSDVWAQGCRNTLVVAERVDTRGMFAHRDLMPRFPAPPGETEQTWFTQEVWRGMARRYPGQVPDDRRRRCAYEVEVICSMGYCGYFLVVADLVGWAKRHDIAVGPGRGSAAGSIVAYALGITDLDPIEHGLLFERFLNPERTAMPDIDVDVDDRRRAEVIRYVASRYGEDQVAQIATFGTIKAKTAIKDAARVLGYPYAVADRITKAMPPALLGREIPLAAITDPAHPRYGEAAEVRGLRAADPEVARVVEVARGLEGLVRQTGVHAAGVILSAEPLVDHVPLMRREDDGAIITQYDYPGCESLGLVKIDILGLTYLTILADAVRNVAATTGRVLDLAQLPLTDQRTYEMLSRGETLGVFQLDGGPMRALLMLMRPDSFADISAALALYRPGPMGAGSHTNYALRKTGQQEVTPIHPELAEPLAEILGPTYGLIVYQEQVQLTAVKVAGYSLGRADTLRKAMGKKIRAVLDAELVPFQAGMRARGYSDAATKALWDVLVPFADYAFTKAHTAAYGLVAYWSAYLKANHPAEYMAALLTAVGDKDAMAVYLGECHRMGIAVLPPDVSSSLGHFTPVDGGIRFGLRSIRNLGPTVVESIIRTRTEKGRYLSFADFLSTVDLAVCNKRTIESLIKAGAFDALGHTRRGLLEVYERAVDLVSAAKRREAEGQPDLFGDLLPTGELVRRSIRISTVEFDRATLLGFERDMLGRYVSSHPLVDAVPALRANSEQSVGQLHTDQPADGTPVTLAGVLVGVTRRVTRKGKAWASARLEDIDGAVEVLFFPKTYELVGQRLADDLIVAVRGRASRHDGPRDGGRDATSDRLSVVVSDIGLVDQARYAAHTLAEEHAP